jgi:hypothetical protein
MKNPGFSKKPLGVLNICCVKNLYRGFLREIQRTKISRDTYIISMAVGGWQDPILPPPPQEPEKPTGLFDSFREIMFLIIFLLIRLTGRKTF